MLSVEDGFIIAKINLVFLVLTWLVGSKFNSLKISEMLFLVPLMLGAFAGRFISENSDFYTFYLYLAANNLLIVTIALFLHVWFRRNHEKVVLFLYGLILTKFISHMVLYRVRTQIYTSDEPIMWLINLQSVLVISCDLIIFLVIGFRLFKWKLYSIRFS